MNITTTVGSSLFRKLPGLPARASGARARWVQRLLHMPVLLWLLVLAAALLAFFVHLLNEQVLRGQLLREEQRAAATRSSPWAVGKVQHPVNQLVTTRQPVTRP